MSEPQVTKIDSLYDKETSALLWLFAIMAIAILPFSIYRFLQQSWVIGTLDLVASTISLGLFYYVYKTKQTEKPALIFSIICLIIAFSTVLLKGVEQVYWSYPLLVIVFFLLKPYQALILNSIFIAILLPTLFFKTGLFTFSKIFVTLSVSFVMAYIFALQRYKQNRKLVALATLDPLTGIGNRRALEEKLENAINTYKRHNIPISLIVLDLDHFKRINDKYGHDVGDEVLVRCAEIITSRIRVNDAHYRFGGEEFVIVAEGADSKGAALVAEEVRNELQSRKIIENETLTLSAGVAQYQAGLTSKDWMKLADRALFKAKKSGRNRVYEDTKKPE